MTSPQPESDALAVLAEPAAMPMAERTPSRRWSAAGLAASALGFLASGLSHVAVIVWGIGLWDMARPLSAAPPPSITVELVPDPWKTRKPDEELPLPSPPKAEPQARTEPQTSPAQPAASPAAPAAAMMPFPTPTLTEPPAPAAIDPDVPTAERLAQMLQLPVDLPDAGEPGGAPSDDGAKVARGLIDAFKTHVQGCWTTPPEAVDDDRVKVLIRVAFRPDGRINGDPVLVQGIATPAGPAVVRNAIAALKRCQPYAFLPAGEYRQWRLLEVAFSAKGVL
jgi:hypothetical protein